MERIFKLKIDCGNSAFCEGNTGYPTRASAAPELARILRQIADRLGAGCSYGKYQSIYDTNGNNVGQFALKTEQG